MDIRLALMSGVDIPFPELQTAIHQPKIKEISYIGEEGFFLAGQFLCLNKRLYIKDENLLQSTTNFQVFMTVLQDSHSLEAREHVLNLMALLFPNKQTLITPQSLILRDLENKETLIIDDNNFEIFQSYLSQILCLSSDLMGENREFNPKGKKAQEIAEKMLAGRKKVAAAKGEDKKSVFSRYVSVLTVGLHMPIQDCLDLTVFQLYDLMERYSMYIGWDIDIKSRLAGAKGEDKIENWMDEIH